MLWVTVVCAKLEEKGIWCEAEIISLHIFYEYCGQCR